MSKYLWCIMTTIEETEETAKDRIATMINCPNLIATGRTKNIIYSVFMVPREMRWWLEYPLTQNEKIGEEKYTVEIIENLEYPKEPPNKERVFHSPPCGATCEDCKLKEEYFCEGCQAVSK